MGLIPDPNAAIGSAAASIPGKKAGVFNSESAPSLPPPLLTTAPPQIFGQGNPLNETQFAQTAAAQLTRQSLQPNSGIVDRFARVTQQGSSNNNNPNTPIGAINMANINKRAPISQTSSSTVLGQGNITGHIPFFLNAVLSTPAGALPKGPLWVVVFDSFPEVIKQAKEYEPQMPEPWEIERAFGTITSPRYQQEKGCVLAQRVSLPGESLITQTEGSQYNGFIRGRVGAGRQDFDLLRMSFLQTNVNFVDNVIRPWAIMTGHLGMISRPPEKNYRTNITVYKLGIINRESYPYIAQQFNFFGACAVNVGSEELIYTADGNQIIKSAEFAYQWYTTRSDKNPFATGAPTEEEPVVTRAVNPNLTSPAVERGVPVAPPPSTFR